MAKWSTCFFDVKCTQIKILIARLFFEISKYFQLLFFMGQSGDALCEVLCESEKGAYLEPVDVVFEFLRCSKKK